MSIMLLPIFACIFLAGGISVSWRSAPLFALEESNISEFGDFPATFLYQGRGQRVVDCYRCPFISAPINVRAPPTVRLWHRIRGSSAFKSWQPKPFLRPVFPSLVDSFARGRSSESDVRRRRRCHTIQRNAIKIVTLLLKCYPPRGFQYARYFVRMCGCETALLTVAGRCYPVKERQRHKVLYH